MLGGGMVTSMLQFGGAEFGKPSSPHHSFHAWEVAWVKMLTFDQLQRWGFPLVSCFPMCQACGEHLDLLLHCHWAAQLWGLFGSYWSALGYAEACGA